MTDHSISTELLGCPFCAADCAELTKAMGEAWIRCPHCDATGGMSSNEALAIKNWNARALTTASDAVAGSYDPATIEACAKIAEGTTPIAAGNFFAARRDQCAIIATKIRALKIADERAKELATLRIPVSYRWRRPGNKHWIYDPTPEWVEDHKHEIELEPLFNAAPDWKQDQAETSRLAGEEQS